MCRFGDMNTPAQLLNSSAVVCTGKVTNKSFSIFVIIAFLHQQITLLSGNIANTTLQLLIVNGSNVYTLDTTTKNVFGECIEMTIYLAVLSHFCLTKSGSSQREQLKITHIDQCVRFGLCICIPQIRHIIVQKCTSRFHVMVVVTHVSSSI